MDPARRTRRSAARELESGTAVLLRAAPANQGSPSLAVASCLHSTCRLLRQQTDQVRRSRSAGSAQAQTVGLGWALVVRHRPRRSESAFPAAASDPDSKCRRRAPRMDQAFGIRPRLQAMASGQAGRQERVPGGQRRQESACQVAANDPGDMCRRPAPRTDRASRSRWAQGRPALAPAVAGVPLAWVPVASLAAPIQCPE